MNRKILFSFIVFLTLLLAVACVSANDNMTDSISLDEDSIDIVGVEDNSNEVMLEDDSNEDVESNMSATNISAEDVETFTDLKDEFTVNLTSNGTALANKSVDVILNGVTYNAVTDKNGLAIISFKLKAGTYDVQFFFYGDDNYTQSNGTATIFVKPEIITYLNVVDKDINYRQGLKSMFQLRLTDVNNKPISGKYVKIQVNGKTYTVKTSANGYATLYLSLNKGTYTIKYWFAKSGLYLASSGEFKIKVKSKLSKGNGYWVNKWDMKKVNLKNLHKKGTKHIFLQHTAFTKYGEKAVLKWIKKAHKYGMKVHIWMAVFYKDGKYIHASNKNGVYNYKHMESKISLAKHYASLKGVDGIHFDYVRFGGNAYKYKNSVAAVNYFIKKACVDVRKVNSNIILSAAVMPEPSSMKYYYAQDVPTMSKYLDAVIPMIYKGNYHASSKWIKKITKKFVKQSKGAKIWAGLQTYKSDWNLKKLSYKSLMKDAKNAKKGGAAGVVLFRFGLSALLNFKKL